MNAWKEEGVGGGGGVRSLKAKFPMFMAEHTKHPVNTAPLGIYLHSSKTRAGCAKVSTMNSKAICSTWRGMGSGQAFWTCRERNKMLPSSRSLLVMGEIVGVNMTSLANIFTVQRRGQDEWKGSTMNSMATCSTWRGMGSIRLYLAGD